MSQCSFEFQLDVGCEIYARGKQREIEEKTGEETERDETSADDDNNENADNVAQTVGHNMYILAYQVRSSSHLWTDDHYNKFIFLARSAQSRTRSFDETSNVK